jgi:hypothetical protein
VPLSSRRSHVRCGCFGAEILNIPVTNSTPLPYLPGRYDRPKSITNTNSASCLRPNRARTLAVPLHVERRCPSGQIKQGEKKMAKKTLKKAKKLEATKPLMSISKAGRPA